MKRMGSVLSALRLLFVCGFMVYAGQDSWPESNTASDTGIRDIAVEEQVDVAVFPQLGHSDRVSSVMYSPDGKQIISSSNSGGDIKIWDAESGRELGTIEGGGALASYSPDGKRIVSSIENTINIWDAKTYQPLRTTRDYSNYISFVAYSPDGSRIASLADTPDTQARTTIKIWNAETGEMIHTLRSLGYSVISVAFSPDSKQIVSVSFIDGIVIKIWDTESGQELRTRTIIQNSSNFSNSVTFSPDGKQIGITDSINNKIVIKVWDLETDQIHELKAIPGRFWGIGSLIVGPDGRQMVTLSPDGRRAVWGGNGIINVWDTETCQELQTLTGHSVGVSDVVLSPDGKKVFTNNRDHTIKVWDMENGRLLDTRAGSFTAFSSDGKRIISSDADNIIIWDAETGQEQYTLKNFNKNYGRIYNITFSPDGKRFIFGIPRDGILKIVDVESGQELHTLRVLSKSDYSEIAFALSPDGNQIVTGAEDRTVKIWDMETGQLLRTLRGHTGRIEEVVFSPDGKRIISWSVDGTTRVWDAENGQVLRTLKVRRGNTGWVTFSPDGKRIVIQSEQGSVWESGVWDIESGQELYNPGGWFMSFSPDGKLIVTKDDGFCTIRNAENGQELRTLPTKSRWAGSMSFSADGKQIVASTVDSTSVWDVETGKEIIKFVAFTGSDTQITAGTRDIAVEDVEQVSAIDGEWIAITPDGYYQASPRGGRYLNVRVGNTVTGIDSYRSVFYNPELVQARLNGRPDPASKASVTIQDAASFLPPTITVQARDTTTSTSATSISVTVKDQNQPIKNIKVIVNGRLLGRDELSRVSGTRGLNVEKTSFTVSGDLKEATFTLPVSLDPGQNLIEVIAFTDYADARQSATVTWQTAQRLPPPNLWILAIGVNRYDNLPEDDQLRYCVSDAQGIIASFKTQEGKLYAKVNTLLIADNTAITPTVKNIRDNLKWLDQAGPRDVIVLFLAGHGLTVGNNFYFTPKDVVTKTKADLIRTAISDTDILSVLDAPGKRLIFIDACHSGGVDGDLMANALMESNGLVFTASEGSERSNEFVELAHGIFTYSIMQGLSGGYNARTQRDIKIAPLSAAVKKFVSEEVFIRRGENQHPHIYSRSSLELTIAVTN